MPPVGVCLTVGPITAYDSVEIVRRPARPIGESLEPMSTATDHYAILGIPRGASPEEIRTAYRRAARASHPDLHPGDATALDRFKRVQVAYEVLGDPTR